MGWYDRSALPISQAFKQPVSATGLHEVTSSSSAELHQSHLLNHHLLLHQDDHLFRKGERKQRREHKATRRIGEETRSRRFQGQGRHNLVKMHERRSDWESGRKFAGQEYCTAAVCRPTLVAQESMSTAKYLVKGPTSTTVITILPCHPRYYWLHCMQTNIHENHRPAPSMQRRRRKPGHGLWPDRILRIHETPGKYVCRTMCLRMHHVREHAFRETQEPESRFKAGSLLS